MRDRGINEGWNRVGEQSRSATCDGKNVYDEISRIVYASIDREDVGPDKIGIITSKNEIAIVVLTI